MLERLRTLLGVRAGESQTVAPALAFAFLAVGALGLSAIASDTLFVSAFSLGQLSRFLVVSSIVRVAVAFAYGVVARRFAGPRADAAILGATAAMMAACGTVARSGSAPVIYVVCLLQLFLPPLLPLVAFNAVMSCFHARQAKRLLPLVAAAATAGSIAVGAGARALATSLGTPSLLYLGALLCFLATPLPSVLGGRSREAKVEAPSGGDRPPAARVGVLSALGDTARDIRAVPVVRIVVLNALIGAMATNFVDFAFKAALKAHYGRDEMAAFLGTFGVVSNAIVLIVQLFLTSRFVGRFGVRAALQTFPASLVLLGPVLIGAPGLPAATAAKGAETVFRFSLGGSVSDLLLTPAPADVRTRAKVFVKGGAGPLGYLASGLVLSLFGSQGPSEAVLGGLLLGVGVVLIIAMLDARRAYTSALAVAIGEGRMAFDVSPNSAAVLRSEVVRHLAESDTQQALRTLAVMGDCFFTVADLAPALRSPSAEIRRAAVQAAVRMARPGGSSGRSSLTGKSLPPPSRASSPSLPPAGPDSAEAEGHLLLELVGPDDDAEVERRVLGAARALGARPSRERAQQALVRAIAAGDGPDAVELWAEALLCLALHERDAAVKQLRKASLGPDSPRRAASLRALGDLVERRAEREVLRGMGSDDPTVFAEAARTAVLIDAPGAIPSLVIRLMAGPNVRAATRALSLAGPGAVSELLAALPTTRGEGAVAPTAVASGRVISGTVRAARVLARLGPDACVRVLDRYSDLGYRARNAVARSFATVPVKSGLAIDPAPVHRAMELTVAYAEGLMDAYPKVRPGLLQREIAYRLDETGARVLDLASVVGDRTLIEHARAALARQERDRGTALELLENVLPETIALRVVALLEHEPRPSIDGSEAVPSVRRPGFDGWLEKCRMFDDKELVLEAPMLGVLEKVLVLRDSSLFMGLSGEELYPVAEIAKAAFFGAGDVVIKQGDPGDALFVIARGTLHVMKGDAKMREMGAGAVFGELALLDGAPRAATVVATTEAQLLRIPRAEFEALLDESPELARGVIRTLIGHLRGGA